MVFAIVVLIFEWLTILPGGTKRKRRNFLSWDVIVSLVREEACFLFFSS